MTAYNLDSWREYIGGVISAVGATLTDNQLSRLSELTFEELEKQQLEAIEVAKIAINSLQSNKPKRLEYGTVRTLKANPRFR